LTRKPLSPLLHLGSPFTKRRLYFSFREHARCISAQLDALKNVEIFNIIIFGKEERKKERKEKENENMDFGVCLINSLDLILCKSEG